MRKILFFILFCSLTLASRAQSSPSTLDIVSWNLEWFGDVSNGPSNNDLQEANVKKIMRFLDADLYGLIEIVDSMRVRRLVDSLGNTEYGFAISPFCSGNTTGTGNAWLTGQKLAFIYRKSVFSNITLRGLLRASGIAYANWASGRFPYMLSATVTINSVSKNINFIVIHGKAGSTATDYERRQGGAQELKDTLDSQFSSSNNFIIGDFNDALNTSIYAGAGGISSYLPIVADSTDANHYRSLTLPLGNAGQTSMIDFPNVIDNHVISDEVEPYYIAGSAKIRTDVLSIIPDYITAHNTSDHYPVFSQYNLGVVTSVPVITPSELGIIAFPNPFKGEFNIKPTKDLTQVQLKLMNIQGQVLATQYYNRLNAGSVVQPALPSLSTGIYLLSIETAKYKTILKLIHL